MSYLEPALNGLLQHDPMAWPEDKIIPDLAQSWEISSDGLTYTFHLRNGVKWHDGKPLTSDDVKISLDRVRQPAKGQLSPRASMVRAISQVDATAPDLVTVHVKYPTGSLASILAIDNLSIYPKHIIDAKGDMKKDIVGTGPFKFKEYVAGSTLEYVKNPDYFVKGRPYLDGVKMFLIRDSATRFAALRTGRIDYLPPFAMSESQVAMAKADPTLVIQTGASASFFHFGMNLAVAPWSDSRVRKAASLAIDREAFITTVFQGNGLLGGPMPPKGEWGYTEDELQKMPGFRQPKDADLAEAKKLLADAGFADGFKTTILTRPEEMYKNEATFVAAELAKIGIKAEIASKELAVYNDIVAKHGQETVAHGTGTAIDDPDMRFGENYVSGAARNYSNYSNPKLDELFQKQAQELDVQARKKMVRQMMDILLEDNPNVGLAWAVLSIGLAANVKDYKMASCHHFLNNKQQEVWLAR